MIETTTNNAVQADNFYDLSEVREAMSDPRYKTSARYRDDVAAKLHRSQAAGTVGRMSEHHPQGGWVYTTEKNTADEGLYGSSQLMTKPASPFGMNMGTFKTLDEIHSAMSAISAIDPTYRQAVTERIERSIREGTLDQPALTQVAAWQAEASAQRGR